MQGAGASAQTELLQNGSFEQDADEDGIPDFWRGRNLGVSDTRDSDAFEGSYSFRITGEPGVLKSFLQSINVRLPRGTALAFRAVSKADGASQFGGKYELRVKLIYEDDTSDNWVSKFSPRKNGWQQEAMTGNLLNDLKKLVVSVTFNDQTGSALFDDVHAEVK